MEQGEFSEIRRRLGKTQKQMAELLGVSVKAVQSFEQGWRRIPVHAERQSLFLLAMKNSRRRRVAPCWEKAKCPADRRQSCPAWEFRAGHLCWFINGTFCRGKAQRSWRDKMKSCRQCAAFLSAMSDAPRA